MLPSEELINFQQLGPLVKLVSYEKINKIMPSLLKVDN